MLSCLGHNKKNLLIAAFAGLEVETIDESTTIRRPPRRLFRMPLTPVCHFNSPGLRVRCLAGRLEK